MAKKIKLLFVLRDLGFGGAERQVVELCKGLDKDRFQVTVVLFFEGPGYLKQLRATGVKVQVLSTKKAYKWNGLFRLMRFFRQEHFDIVHAYLPIANFLGGLAAKLTKQKNVICSLRNASPFSLGNIFCVMDLIALNGFCDKVVVNSKSGKACSVKKYGVPQDKVKVIYNGKDIEAFMRKGPRQDLRKELGIAEGDIVITSIGRVCRQKGHKDLALAANILINERGKKALRVLIVGKPEERFAELQTLIQRHSLEPYVKLLGVRQDVSSLLGLTDVFVLPSLWEGLANVLLEAIIAKVPVVATDIGPNREVIENNRTGRLVPVRDPGSLAQAIEEALNDRGRSAEMAQKAFEDVTERFGLDRLVQEQENMYLSLCRA